MVGRRVPRSWLRRQGRRVMDLLSFQENIFQMIKMALNMAKKKANASGKLRFVLTNFKEKEDLNYELQWIKVVIQGTEEQEKEEYEESLQLYAPLSKVFKSTMPKGNDEMKKRFKTNAISMAKVDEAYEKGYGSIGDDNLASKLLEMGILTHIEWIKDFDSRDIEITPDFGD